MDISIKQSITDAGATARIAIGIINREPGYLPTKIKRQLIAIEKSLDEINLASQGLVDNGADILTQYLGVEEQRKDLEEQLLQSKIKTNALEERLKKYYYTVTLPEVEEELSLEDGVRYGRFVTHKGSAITLTIPMDMITLPDFHSFIKRNKNPKTERLMINGVMTEVSELFKPRKKV